MKTAEPPRTEFRQVFTRLLVKIQPLMNMSELKLFTWTHMTVFKR